MLILLIQQAASAGSVLRSAYSLSQSLKKDFGLLSFAGDENHAAKLMEEMRILVKNEQMSDVKLLIRTEQVDELSEICENIEVSFLLIQLQDNRSKTIQRHLTACRGLRIPYLLYKDTFGELKPDKLIVPVIFLEEEYEKAQFASAFGRFCRSSILILQASDYGSKAKLTVEKITLLLDKFQLNYAVEKAKGDSFKVEKEAVQRAERENYGLILLSASRDYGLDDLLFGPKERHLIRKSTVPVLLINPRGDLYTLCD